MEKIKIKIVDFWSSQSMFHHFLITLLKNEFQIEISDSPDVLFFSCYGDEHKKYHCPKIFYTGENIRPNFSDCDFSLSFDYDDYNKRNFRLPLFILYYDLKELLCKTEPLVIKKEKEKFCNIVVSNPHAKERISFFKKLSKYKKVDSGGRYLNNIGGSVKNKIEFVNKYKFTIAFENASYPGYTSEKIIQPMIVNSIPIYWGNPLISKDFNEKSFINLHSSMFDTVDDVIDFIEEVDKNDDLYFSILKEYYFKSNIIPNHLKREKVLEKLKFFLRETKKIPKSKVYIRPYNYRIKQIRSNIGLSVYKMRKKISKL